MQKKMFGKTVTAFLISFLFFYMLLIFGPAEIFFANVGEFEFLYGEFAGWLIFIAFICSMIVTAFISVLPDIIYKIVLAFLGGLSVAGYIQVMFLNKNLDLLGMNPDGYQLDKLHVAKNIVLWLGILILFIVVACWKGSAFQKMIRYFAAFLLCIQLVALCSLLLTAKEDAYKRPVSNWHLSGAEQYMVSGQENIIVLILDFFSNQYIDSLNEVYPGSTDFLHDFTYYSNMDCVYYGTFPSLPHMLTGCDLDMTIPTNDWFPEIWTNQTTVDFYNMLQEKNYKVNIYTPDASIICGTHGAVLLDGKVSNVVNEEQELEVNTGLLLKTMTKMSCYRMFPDIIKPYFYTNIREYADIVSSGSSQIMHNNYDFYSGLQNQGLRLDKTSNYFIVQHLMGAHEYTTDAAGNFKENSSREETTKGCMVIVEEYLNQLKELGVYDDATIIITSDHGGGFDPQVIFYIKRPEEQHAFSPVTDAPVSFCELLPTLADAAGEKTSSYGPTIYEFEEGEQRERTLWERAYDVSQPAVPCYTGDKDGDSNVFIGFTYTGDAEELMEQIKKGPTKNVRMIDSFF